MKKNVEIIAARYQLLNSSSTTQICFNDPPDPSNQPLDNDSVNVESYKLQAQRFVRIVPFLSVMRFLADGVSVSREEEDEDQENSIEAPAIVSVLYSVGNRGSAARDVNHSWHPFHFSPFISPFYPSDSSVQPLHLVAGELKEEGGGRGWKKLKKEERRNGERAGGSFHRRAAFIDSRTSRSFSAEPEFWT